MKSRRLAVYGLTAGLLGGGGAGLLMTGTTLAGAQTEVTDPAATTDTTAADPSATTTAPATPAPVAESTKPAKTGWAKSALDKLVADGTITQAQADKVLAALNEARPAKGGRGHGPGRGGFGKLDAAASVLGMSAEELRTALQGGKNLATIAGEKGIAVSKVVDALVAELKTHLAEHVASGRNTQAEADQMLAGARARIEAFVNGTAPAGGFGPGGRGRGHNPKGGVPAAPSSGTSSSGNVTS